MKNLLILHGSYSDPEKNWFQYLKKKAEGLGFVVNVPQLDLIKDINIEKTYQLFLEKKWINSDTVMVGHSSGATLILRIIQKLSPSIVVKKALLVAAFVDANLTTRLLSEIPRTDFDHLFAQKWEWEKIKQHCKKFIIFHAPDDPYVQMRHAYFLKAKLDSELVIVPGGGHFSIGTRGDRFKEFPQLLQHLE